MAKKRKTQEVSKPKTKDFLMLQNVGTNKDGSPRMAKGTVQPLTKKQEEDYKSKKLI